MDTIYGAYQDAEAKRQEMQLRQLQMLKQQQDERQLQAQLGGQSALLRSLSAPPPSAPMAGQGGPQPPQGGQPMPPGGGGAPMGGQMPQGAPGGPQPGPAGPPMQQQPQQPGMGAGNQPMQILKGLVQQLKAANPGADDRTLFSALEQQIGLMRGVQPEVKDQLQAALAEMRIGQAQQRIAIQSDSLAARIQQFDRRQGDVEARNQIRAQLDELRRQILDDQLHGIDPRLKQRHLDRLDEMEKGFLFKEDPLKASNMQVREINSEISELLHGRSEDMLKPNERQDLQALQAKRKALVDKTVAAGVKKDELRKALVSKSPPEAEPAEDTLDEAPANTPAAAPEKTAKYTKGQIIEGSDGKKYRVTGGDPNDPDVELVP